MRYTTSDYFDQLWEGLDGRAVIALLDENRAPRNQRFFVWPGQRPQLLAYVEQNADKDVYTCPTLFKANRARKSVAKSTRVVHADDDGFESGGQGYLAEPSMTVHTSPGHKHDYWLISDTTDPSVIEPLAHSVSDTHSKDEGLDNCWAVNHLLRVPGTSNTKYAEPFPVTFETTGAVYTLDEFSAVYPPVIIEAAQFREMRELPGRGDALSSLRASPELMRMMNKTSAGNVDRSDALFLLEQELFRSGADDEAAYVICLTHAFNKFADKTNGDEKLWEDILRARAKSESGVPEEADEIQALVTVEPSKKDKSVDFLTAEEKLGMAPTFIDDYRAWAESKTDAATEYHVASAFTILATVFSDFGHALPKYGPVNLNLWFMILGETTRSRKSTTRGQMLKFIKALSDDENYHYDLGSDFTPEALDNALLERPYRSALLHRDEAQGWIQEMDKKAYMAGAKQKMTELFDGHVSGKLRATGDQKRRPSVEVSLNLYLMGIASQVAEYLTQDDFRSGFLTRFIFIEGKPAPRSRESDWVEQADIHEIKMGDEVFTALVNRIEKSRQHWENFVQPDGPTVAVPASKEAWARLWLFVTQVLDEAEGSARHAIIDAASQRLAVTIMKVATLLAMMDCCDEVELPHMLSAINYASSWFGHMVNMANRISESGWARRQTEVEEYVVMKGGTAKWETVYRHFRTELKPEDFIKIIQALSDAGVIHTYHDDKKQRWIERIDMEEELAA